MDPLDAFFKGPRSAHSFLLLAQMGAPWAIEVRDESALTALVVTSGSAILDGRELTAGDVALVRGPLPYRVTDARGSSTTIVVDPGQVCRAMDGRPVHEEYARGLRRWGNTHFPDTTMLIGAYASDGAVAQLVTQALPRLMVVQDDPGVRPLAELLVAQTGTGGLGQRVVLDRLLDALVITAVRAGLTHHSSTLPASWLSTRDPLVTELLTLVHAQPERAWTVGGMADAVHVSRATLAARFRSATGMSPMAYLTRWRLSLAADRLLLDGSTIAVVARSVGYENAFAFSAAFKRHHGFSPSQHRARASLVTAGSVKG